MQRKLYRQDSSGSDTYEPDTSGKVKEKRNAHTAAEQKRRDAIKNALVNLQQLVPGCNSCEMSHGMITKTSKAQVLQKAIEYVTYLSNDRDRKNEEINEMEKKLVALKIVKENYENLVESSQHHDKPQISDEMKLSVFQQLMSSLWENFNTTVSVGSFQSLSGSMIRWVEEHCKPDIIKTIIVSAMKHLLGH
ncbi:max-like protein X [Clytia hemisphaerica]|uniref:BHLH domain-containing protein n=1 Tax=Clytia hemisphaerica TaxID=252671 RepID=A0A7M5WZP2_9CNID|eukprot:TCONS_00002749-protein